MSNHHADNKTSRFIEQVIGMSISSGMRITRKQYLKDIKELVIFLSSSRKLYFKLKVDYPEIDIEVLSLIASVLAAKEIEAKTIKAPRPQMPRKQCKRDYLLNHAGLISEWLENGVSFRGISNHLKSHHRQSISATYIHQVAVQMGWKGSDNGN